MKALSIKQPWASLIAHGIKDIENRTWKTNYRGRIYIHASGKFAGDVNELFSNQQWDAMYEEMRCSMVIKDFPMSAIIGEVDIVDCVINHPSIWGEKSKETIIDNSGASVVMKCDAIYNWILENPIFYNTPILNVKGKLSLWGYNVQLNET